MPTVRDLIRKKGSEVWSIAPEASVFAAMQLMAEKNIGALLVMRGREIAGILSERDCVRKVDILGRSSRETKVGEIMTARVLYSQKFVISQLERFITGGGR